MTPTIPFDPVQNRLGILAGNGVYPVLLAERLYKNHIPFVVAGLRGQTKQDRFPKAEAYADVAVGAMERTANFFIAQRTSSIFFSGGIRRESVWKHLRPDRIGFGLIRNALLEGDNRFLQRCAKAFTVFGIEVLDPAPLLEDLFATPGHFAGPPAAPPSLADLNIARTAALILGSKDRGQAAVALDGAVIGLENRRGTDALLRSKGRPRSVLVKMVKPGQDRRFDLPAIGRQTIATAHQVGIRAVGLDTQGVLILEKEDVIAGCNRYGISLYGLNSAVPPED